MAWLDSVSSLNVLSHQDFDSTVLSAATEAAALPLFLQDQGTFSSTRELFSNLQVGPQPEAKELTKQIFFQFEFSNFVSTCRPLVLTSDYDVANIPRISLRTTLTLKDLLLVPTWGTTVAWTLPPCLTHSTPWTHRLTATS